MSITYGNWLAADAFVKLYPIISTLDLDGSQAFRKDVNAQRSMDPLGYGSIIPRWAAERQYRFDRTWGAGMTKEWDPPSNVNLFKAAQKMKAKSSVLAIQVGDINIHFGAVVGCLAIDANGVVPYSFRPLSMDGQGEVPNRKVHSFAVNGCWIDEKYYKVVGDAEVNLHMNLITGGQVCRRVSTTKVRTRQVAMKPSLRQLLNASLGANNANLSSGDIVFFSTEAVKVGSVSVHGSVEVNE